MGRCRTVLGRSLGGRPNATSAVRLRAKRPSRVRRLTVRPASTASTKDPFRRRMARGVGSSSAERQDRAQIGSESARLPAVLRCSARLAHTRRPASERTPGSRAASSVGPGGFDGRDLGDSSSARILGPLAGLQIDGQRGRCKHPGRRREATDSDPARHCSCGLPTTGGPGVRSSRPRPERPTRVLRALSNPRGPAVRRQPRGTPDPYPIHERSLCRCNGRPVRGEIDGGFRSLLFPSAFRHRRSQASSNTPAWGRL